MSTLGSIFASTNLDHIVTQTSRIMNNPKVYDAPLAALVQVIYTAGLGVLYGAIYLRTRSIWGVMLLHTLTDITAFIAVLDGNTTGMDILFCVFGTLLFVALALYLIRPAKR